MRPDQISMAGITGYGWQAAFDALMLAINGISGIREQPRCEGKYPRQYNAAGEYLEDLQEILSLEVDRLRRELRGQPIPDIEEWEIRCRVLIALEAFDHDRTMAEMAAFAQELAEEGKARLEAEGATC